MIEPSQRQAARIFAITTLIMYVVVMIAFTRFYAPFLVWGDEAVTARNFSAHEPLLHFYIALAVVFGIGSIIVMAALYVMFRPISRGLTLFAASTRLVGVVMWFIGLIDLFDALRIMRGAGYLQAFKPEHLQALAGLQLASGWDAYYIGLTISPIGSVLFSYLFFKSRYVPRALAVCGMAASLFEGVCGFAYLIDRNFGAMISVNWYEMPVFFFDVALCIWILVRGLAPRETAELDRRQVS
ncbi:MAG: DUF4386 domain-containing protein [Terracidiphilus sp.]|jgi:hypothetical protein